MRFLLCFVLALLIAAVVRSGRLLRRQDGRIPWLATVIAFAVWWPGAAFVHIKDIVVSGNYAPNNAGITVYMDILVPLILIALLTYYDRASRSEHERTGTV